MAGAGLCGGCPVDYAVDQAGQAFRPASQWQQVVVIPEDGIGKPVVIKAVQHLDGVAVLPEGLQDFEQRLEERCGIRRAGRPEIRPRRRKDDAGPVAEMLRQRQQLGEIGVGFR
ncbi:hypothetical protein ACFOOQ_05610 [Ferrovibrio xuzhouensis]|uniref:Uncharacterized protein n=1 Tax=Ferrovibrio xuzhouensis TaxID=1576914 RepID=A0ABV7VDJ4_9PROT